MKIKLMIGVVVSAFWLAACGAPAVTPGVPTQPQSVLPTPAASPIQPGGGLSTRPEAEAWKNAPAAALNARADLVGQVNVDPNTITLVSVEEAEWPDGCLGVQTPGVMCTMVITPGYRVVLETGGRQYDYHTNAAGDVVRLASVTPQT